jgi:hypothetical protein
MFGALPGEERRLGKLNQYVVSKVITPSHVYWVFHTLGESPISVLIDSLKQVLHIKEAEWREIITQVRNTSTISELSIYNMVKATNVVEWNGKKQGTLESFVNKMKESGVTAYEIIGGVE